LQIAVLKRGMGKDASYVLKDEYATGDKEEGGEQE
jgi:hypothetical protein